MHLSVSARSSIILYKESLSLSLSTIHKPKDGELFSEHSATLTTKTTSAGIGFFFENGFHYSGKRNDFFPFINTSIVDEEIKYRNQQFLPDNKIETLIEHLSNSPDSKRGIINLRHEKYADLSIGAACVTHLFFRITQGGLDMHVTSRASNAYKLLLLDIDAMQALQKHISSRLGITANNYVHFIHSLHIYQEELAEAQQQHKYMENNQIWSKHT